MGWSRGTEQNFEETSNGYWRVNNSPTIKRVAKHQQTKQKSKHNFDLVFAYCKFHSSELKFLATGVLTAKSPVVKSETGADAARHKCSRPQL
jgi:hypothetical protein